MIRRLVGELPDWMRADHPMLRYALDRPVTDSQAARYRRALVFVLLAVIFLLVGYINASNFFEDNPFDLPFSQFLIEMLFWPTFIVQVGLQIAVLLTTMGAISDQKHRQIWDSLRATPQGAALTLRTRWTAVVFYRLRSLLSVLLLVRLILIAGLLFDLTAFQGEYLRNLTGRIEPQVALPVSVILLAMLMTASFLLPLTTVGFDAAFGLLVSTFVQQRTYVVLTQIVLVAIRLAMIAGLAVVVEQYRGDTLDLSSLIIWLVLLGYGVIGDWGLSFLYLGFYGARVWIEVPYGIMIGPALLLVVMLQAVMTDLILAYAIRRAERTE